MEGKDVLNVAEKGLNSLRGEALLRFQLVLVILAFLSGFLENVLGFYTE